MTNGMFYLRVKIKSLGEESRIIKQEEYKAKKFKQKDLHFGLRQHRLLIVRNEARHSLLAYAALKGKSYHKVEKKTRTIPNFQRVVELALKFGTEGFFGSERMQRNSELRVELEKWVKEAKQAKV